MYKPHVLQLGLRVYQSLTRSARARGELVLFTHGEYFVVLIERMKDDQVSAWTPSDCALSMFVSSLYPPLRSKPRRQDETYQSGAEPITRRVMIGISITTYLKEGTELSMSRRVLRSGHVS